MLIFKKVKIGLVQKVVGEKKNVKLSLASPVF